MNRLNDKGIILPINERTIELLKQYIAPALYPRFEAVILSEWEASRPTEGIPEVVATTEGTPTLTNYPAILDVKHVKEILRIGRDSAYRLMRGGEFKVIMVGKQMRVSKKVFAEYLAKQV